MAGITRYFIKGNYNTPGGTRIIDAKKYWSAANSIYREVFDKIGLTLLPGDEVVEVEKDEFEAGYDSYLGIDVVLHFESNNEATLQEKFLFTGYNTVTVEHCQDWLKLTPGDWFNLKAHYYFVGYDNGQLTGTLCPWVLLDWPSVQRATGQRLIHWKLNGNNYEKVKAKASFMFIDINKLPDSVIIDKSLEYSHQKRLLERR